MDLSSQRQSPNVSTGVRLQAPLVDSVSCYCRVDSSLKTVVEARKFVPGSKLCIQPNINPNAHRRSKNNPKQERTRIQPPLLPGLPDDLAIACLIRVPRAEHRKLRLVCKSWYRLASGNFYYSERKLIGMSEEWVYVFKKDRDGKISWTTFDLVSHHPHPLPPLPRENDMSMSLVDVLNHDKNNTRIWENIAVKGQSKSVLSNIWSSIAGRAVKSHIVHCQVLQA
ncbi:unnamed protein product [Eruca vesicaria subsp. sativa]|uniref:F-box domain-containing protein n=1 Tax=Eruca vesicaria subsp. sativa TaxID=29727 RepID=A0ABC8IZ06_ERUVS|nr:unnamed protein product [Eruca vesicaria subsp. sativa]